MTGARKHVDSPGATISSPTAASVPAGRDADRHAQADEVGTRVLAERIDLLYAKAPLMLFMAVLFSTVVAASLSPVVDGDRIVLWWIANNFVSAVRYLLVLGYRREKPSYEAAGAWTRPFILLGFVSGVIWGLMGTWLFPHNNAAYQALVMEFLVGISAVALFSYGGLAVAYAAAILPVLLPPAAYLFSIGGAPNFTGGLGLLLFALIAIAYSYRYQGETAEAMRLRFLNERVARERERESALLAAQHASEVKSQFLANMSHEIRTPLNGILGMTQLLAESKLDEEQRFRLDMVHRSGAHLLVLINDILDLSRIEAGRITFDNAPFDLRKTVAEVTDLLTPVAADKGLAVDVRLDAGVPAWVGGDAARVKQVLHNLLGNAIKFTDQGSVRVEVGQSRDGEDALLFFDVTDSGPGIPPEGVDAIFEPFRQLGNSPVQRAGGSAIRGDRERCLEAGMDDYLSKPFTAVELKHCLERWVGSEGAPGMISTGGVLAQ